MSYQKSAILYGIAFILQFSMINLLSVASVTPNLILCLTIFITYKYNQGYRPALVGVLFALLTDVIGGQYVGVSALALFLVCLAIAYFGRDLNRDNLWTLIFVGIAATPIYYFMTWVMMVALGNPTNIMFLLKFLLISIPANLTVILLSFLVFSRKKKDRTQRNAFAAVNKIGRRRNRTSNRYIR